MDEEQTGPRKDVSDARPVSVTPGVPGKSAKDLADEEEQLRRSEAAKKAAATRRANQEAEEKRRQSEDSND